MKMILSGSLFVILATFRWTLSQPGINCQKQLKHRELAGLQSTPPEMA
jgi:hypothetical protein